MLVLIKIWYFVKILDYGKLFLVDIFGWYYYWFLKKGLEVEVINSKFEIFWDGNINSIIFFRSKRFLYI